jgi:hypothetical protein
MFGNAWRNSFVLLSISFVVLSGCSNVTNRSEVIGTYISRHQGNVETLELHPDGTYTVRFKGAGGPDSIYSDKWNFEPYYGEPKVSLQNFSDHFPQSSPRQATGITLLGIERAWGKIRLYRNYDRDEYFSKESNK